MGKLLLEDDLLEASGAREVVDIGRAEIGLDRVGDVGDRHAELLRLDAVDVDEQLRRIGPEKGIEAGE